MKSFAFVFPGQGSQSVGMLDGWGDHPVVAQTVQEAPLPTDGAGRRTRLRQYQVQLLERMQAARSNTGARINQLGVMIGTERYLLDLTQAGEIVPVAPVTVVPLTQSWYLGLANIRGNLISVIDLARYYNEAAETVTETPAE